MPVSPATPPTYPTPTEGSPGLVGGASPPLPVTNIPALALNTYGKPTRVLSAERAWWGFNPGVVAVDGIPEAFANQFILDVELSKSDQAVADPTWLTTAEIRVYRRNTTTGVTGLIHNGGTRHTLILEAGYEYFVAGRITSTTSADLSESAPFPDGLVVVRASPRPYITAPIQEPDGLYLTAIGDVQSRQQDFDWRQAFAGADPGADVEAAEQAWYSAVRSHVPGVTWWNADYSFDPYIGPPSGPPAFIFDEDAGSVGGTVAGYVFHYEAGQSNASFVSAHARIDLEEDPSTAGPLGDGTTELAASGEVFAAWNAAGAPAAMVAWDDEPPIVDRVQKSEVRAVTDDPGAIVDLGVEWYGMPMRDEASGAYGAWGNDTDSGFAVGTGGGPLDVTTVSIFLFNHSGGTSAWQEFFPSPANGYRYVFHGFPQGWDAEELPPGISGSSSPDPLTEVMQQTDLGLQRRYQVEAVPYRVVLNPVVVPVVPVYRLGVVRLYPRDDGYGMSSAARIYPPPKAQRVIGGYR